MITKDITIMELLQNYPELISTLKAKGMACSNCMGASSETIEQGIHVHGLSLVDVLKELNDTIKKDNL